MHRGFACSETWSSRQQNDSAMLQALREGTAPADSYVFHNVSRSREMAAALDPLRRLWREMTLARCSPAQRAEHKAAAAAVALPGQGGPRSLTRLGVGAEGSGTPFHDHEPALNLALAGRKRWLVARPATELAVVSPADLLRDTLPSEEFRHAWAELEGGGKAWGCTQQAGDVVYVPDMFLHATVNLEETVAAAVQCENTDPRKALSALNALIVHASPGAAAAPGPCGTQWCVTRNANLTYQPKCFV